MLSNNKKIKITIFCMIILTISVIAKADEEASAKRELLLFQDIPVVVTASKYIQSVNEAPASVTVITSKDIERYGYRSLDEILMNVRSFYVTYNRFYTQAGVRGFGRPSDFNNRILLLINGHTMNEPTYGSAYMGRELVLNLDSIDRIEIVRGPVSALYGTGAMFAVVNIITKDGGMIDGIKLQGNIGSYNRGQGGLTFGKEFANGLEILISGILGDIKGQDLYYKEYDDPTTNNGIAKDMDWEKYHGLLAKVRYGNLVLNGLMLSREKGIPTAAWGMIFNDKLARSIDKHNYLEIKYDRPIGNNKNIVMRSYFDNYFYKGSYPYDGLNEYETNRDNWMGGEFRFNWEKGEYNKLTFGTEYQSFPITNYRYWSDSELYFDGNYRHSIASLYLQNEYDPIKSLKIILGIRGDKYFGVARSITPRVALMYYPGRFGTLKFLYGEAFRAPNINEVNYGDEDWELNEGEGWRNDNHIKPEKIKTGEIIWENNLKNGFTSSISLYKYKVFGLIDQVELPDSTIELQNINKVETNGVEFELNKASKTGLSGYLSYSFQIAKDDNSGQEMTNSPNHIVKMGLVYPIYGFLYASLGLQYETERITVYDTKTKPYLLTNFNLSTKPLFNHLSFSFLISNLMDKEYKFPGGYEHEQDAIVQDGRNFTLKVEYKF